MNKFIFTLLSSLLSGALSGSILAIISYFRDRHEVPHPHQILPNWMILFGIGFIFSSIITLLWSMYSIFYKGVTNPNLLKTVLIMAGIGSSIVGLGLLYFKMKSN
jgi:hypothetical protein